MISGYNSFLCIYFGLTCRYLPEGVNKIQRGAVELIGDMIPEMLGCVKCE